MYKTSNEYKRKILEPTRKFESVIKIGNITLTNEEVNSFSLEQSIQQDSTYSIGNTISTAFNLVFFHNDTIEINDTDFIAAKLGLLLDNSIEYIPLGIYNIDKIESSDTTTTVLAYDNMIKFEVSYIENNENPTLYSVVNRLIELTGVNFAGNLGSYEDYILSRLEGYSCREILGFIAGILGANVIIDRNGNFNFVVIGNNPIYGKNELCSILTKEGYILQDKFGVEIEINTQTGYITADNYSDYTKKNKNYKVSRITNSTDTEELSIGTNENMELSMSNPYVNESILKTINNNLNGLEFLPYSVTWQGDISLDVGDLVTVTDKKGSVRVHPVLTQSISYNGALNCIIGAQGETTVANTYKSTTSEKDEIIRTGKKVVQIQKDAGEVYVVVYDKDNQSSVRLTERTLEAIAKEIRLTADNIILEGLVTANGNFKIREDGSIETQNGVFKGEILSESIDEEGYIIRTGIKSGNLSGGRYMGDGEIHAAYGISSEGIQFYDNSTMRGRSASYGIDKVIIAKGDGLILFQVNALGELIPGSTYDLNASFGIGVLFEKDLAVNGRLGANRILKGGRPLGEMKATSVYSGSQSIANLGDYATIYSIAKFTNLTANTTKIIDITFEQPFKVAPFITTTVNTKKPEQCSVGVTNVTTTGFTLNLTRTDTSDTSIFWKAEGLSGYSDSSSGVG